MYERQSRVRDGKRIKRVNSKKCAEILTYILPKKKMMPPNSNDPK